MERREPSADEIGVNSVYPGGQEAGLYRVWERFAAQASDIAREQAIQRGIGRSTATKQSNIAASPAIVFPGAARSLQQNAPIIFSYPARSGSRPSDRRPRSAESSLRGTRV